MLRASDFTVARLLCPFPLSCSPSGLWNRLRAGNEGKDERVTVFMGVPTMYVRLLQARASLSPGRQERRRKPANARAQRTPQTGLGIQERAGRFAGRRRSCSVRLRCVVSVARRRAAVTVTARFVRLFSCLLRRCMTGSALTKRRRPPPPPRRCAWPSAAPRRAPSRS